MKINKYFLGLVAVVMVGLSSCNTDVEGTTYSTDPSLQSLSFDAAEQSLTATADQSEISTTIRLTRGVTAGAKTVNFTAEASEEGIFTNDCNGSITFADGQNEAVIAIKAANLEKEKSYTYTITLDDAAKASLDTIAKPQQNLKYVIKVTREGDWTEWKKWNSTGTATYVYSGFFFNAGEDPGLPFSYRQSLTNENKYQFKVEHCFYDVTFIFNYDKETGDVSVPITFTGYTHAQYGQIMIADFKNYSASQPYGTFNEKLGIFNFLIYYYDPTGPWDAGYEYLYIDGVPRADYSITDLTYAGIYTDASNNVFAVANLALAADASNVKAVVVAGDADADAVADAIASGDVAGADVVAGQINVPIEDGLTGALKIVVVSLDAEGKVASTASANFEYWGGGANPWKSLGKGYLTDNFFITGFYKDQATQTTWTAQTYEVEIQENQDTPGLYRIVNAFEEAMKLVAGEAYTQYYEPSNMDVNATDASAVYFQGQPIGYAGSILYSYGGWLLAGGQYTFDELKGYGVFGKLENGTITLPKVPYYDANDQPTGEYYQGWRITSDNKRYYAGWVDDGAEFKIVLPTASSNVKKRAARMAKASRFERGLHSFDMAKNNRQYVKSNTKTIVPFKKVNFTGITLKK